MTSFSRSIGFWLGVASVAVVLTPSADAAQAKRVKRPAVATAVVVAPAGRVVAGQLVAGPNQVVFSDRVVGTDPDPNIRAFMARDLSGFFGGGGP
jgi:hypothetical protein